MTRHTAAAVLVGAALAASSPAAEQVFTNSIRYVMGENDSRKTAREQALEQVKREVLEQVGVLVTAETTLTESSREQDGRVRDEADYRRAVRQVTAGETRSRTLAERWEAENEAVVLYLTCEVRVKPDDVRRQIRELEQARQRVPSDELRDWVEQLQWKIEALQQQGAASGPGARAVAPVSQALQSPDAVQLMQARRLLRGGMHKEAIALMRKHLRMHGKSAEAHILLAEAYAQQKGGYNLAVREAKKALVLAPTSTQARLALAEIHLHTGRDARLALDMVRQVLSLDPSNPSALRLQAEAKQASSI